MRKSTPPKVRITRSLRQSRAISATAAPRDSIAAAPQCRVITSAKRAAQKTRANSAGMRKRLASVRSRTGGVGTSVKAASGTASWGENLLLCKALGAIIITAEVMPLQRVSPPPENGTADSGTRAGSAPVNWASFPTLKTFHAYMLPANLRPGSKLFGELRRIVSFGFWEAAARGCNWATMALLPLLLTLEEYGQVGLIVSIQALVASVLLFGQDRSILRFYGSEENRPRFLNTVVWLWAGFSVILLFFLCPVAVFSGGRIFGVPVFPHLVLLYLALVFLNLNRFCICISRVNGALHHFAMFRCGFEVLKLVAVLAITGSIGTSLGYVLGLAAALLVTTCFGVPFLHHRAGGAFEPPTAARLCHFGWPFVFHLLSGSVLSYFSRFTLHVFSDSRAVGLYTLACTIGAGVFVFYAALASYFEPAIYRFAEDRERSERWLSAFGLAAVGSASFLGIAILVFLPFVVERFLGPAYQEISGLVPIILASTLVWPIYLQGHYRLMVYRKTPWLALSTFLAAVVNILLNLALIPRLGVQGAALALLFSNLFLCLLLYAVSVRSGRLPWHSIRGLPGVAVVVACSLGLAFAESTPICVLLLTLVVVFSVGSLTRDVHGAWSRVNVAGQDA